jgi:hypothetical protein
MQIDQEEGVQGMIKVILVSIDTKIPIVFVEDLGIGGTKDKVEVVLGQEKKEDIVEAVQMMIE